ncbi:transcription factor S [Candidatus Pacearchaeota archaeon]|nr:transcription factor S [Candidatus Pacearchaeota archaeon]
MEFCPKCGAVLVQKRKNDGCPRCNYSAKGHTELKTSEKVEEVKQIAVVREGQDEILPIVNDECKACGCETAYFWTVQTRASDESETKFFKCTKCSHTRRDYR